MITSTAHAGEARKSVARSAKKNFIKYCVTTLSIKLLCLVIWICFDFLTY